MKIGELHIAKWPLLLSGFSVLVATLLLGYSAYGWVTFSRRVTATAADVTITAPNNLEISIDGIEYFKDVTANMADIVKQTTADDTRPFQDGDQFALLPASSYLKAYQYNLTVSY